MLTPTSIERICIAVAGVFLCGAIISLHQSDYIATAFRLIGALGWIIAAKAARRTK